MTAPRVERRGTVEQKVAMLRQLPDGWVVFKYEMSPKLGYQDKVFPMFWAGPGSKTWAGSMDGTMPEQAKVFATGDEARAAMRAEGIPVRAVDDIEQTSLF